MRRDVGFHSFEGDVCFLDLFHQAFLEHVTRDGELGTPEKMWKDQYETFVEVLKSPLEDRHHENIAWIVDRIAHHTNLKPSSSYPRKRPPKGPEVTTALSSGR